MTPPDTAARPARSARRARLGQSLLVALVSSVLVLLGASPAFAHAGLDRSDPADGATLTAAPRQVQLTFTEAVAPDFVTVTLTSGGTRVPLGAPTVVQATVTQPVPVLADGPYVLAYRIVSGDGHPVTGRVGFTVAAPAPTQVATTAAAPPSVAPPTTAAAEAVDQDASEERAASEERGASDQDGGIPVWAWVVVGVVVGAVVLAAAVVAVRRTSRESD